MTFLGTSWTRTVVLTAIVAQALTVHGSWAKAGDLPAKDGTDTASPVGLKVADFVLRDYRGQEHRLSDYADSKLVVIAFLGVECPLVKLYAPRLEELADRYADRGVTFLGINSNLQDPPTKIAAFAQRAGIEFPILKDADNAVADQLRAVRTPEMYVLDGERIVRYHGRIDDQYGFTTGVGYGKSQVTRHDLAEALDELLSGRSVSVPKTEAPGCHIGRAPKVAPHGDVTYSGQIARIINDRCVSCHRPGQIGPFPLTSYEEVLGWGAMINEVVDQGRMPPWHANPQYGHWANDPRLSDDEKRLLTTWVANGMPEGDPSELPAPPQYVEGWGIPQPDAVYYIDDEPFKVAAEGVIDYQYFVVDPGYTKDVWLQAFECRPGNYSVVHHIIAFIQEPDGKRTEVGVYAPGVDPAPPSEVNGDYIGPGGERPISGRGGASRGAQIGYAPGMPPSIYDKGRALRVPAGSKFVFQMHYTAAGTEQFDRSCLGVVFADPATVKQEVHGGVCGTVSFEIPPGASDHVITTKRKLLRDTLIVGYMPHMHVRGTAFRYEAVYPDGTTEILLDVPRYDFNWQLWYQPVEGKLLPKGTRLICTAHYDNSADNVYNPDPTATVRFGEQTWEEMMFGWFVWIDPHADLKADTQAPQDESEPDLTDTD